MSLHHTNFCSSLLILHLRYENDIHSFIRERNPNRLYVLEGSFLALITKKTHDIQWIFTYHQVTRHNLFLYRGRNIAPEGWGICPWFKQLISKKTELSSSYFQATALPTKPSCFQDT